MCPNSDDKTANLAACVRLIRTAVATLQPHCVALPEFCFTPCGRRDLYAAHAERLSTGVCCNTLARLAAELRVWIVCGSLLECDDRRNIFNTMCVFNGSGELVAKHRQVHMLNKKIRADNTRSTMLKDDAIRAMQSQCTDNVMLSRDDCDKWCRRDDAEMMRVGDTLCTTFDMDGVRVGCCVGTDLLYGCVAQCCRERGCDLLLCAVSLPERWGLACAEKLLCVRALEAGCFVVGLTTAAKADRDIKDEKEEIKTCGRTMCVDPCGRLLCVAGKGEEILMQRCDFAQLKDVRCLLPVFESRRSDLY